MERTIQRPSTVDIESATEVTTEVVKPQAKAEIKPLPASKLNLEGIKGYTEKRKNIKLLKMKQDVIDELASALDIFDPEEINLNHTAVLFCSQIVEDIFTKSKQGDLKKEIVVEVCKRFFNGDEALVNMVLELVFEKVIKTTFYRRNKERIKNVLSWLLNMVGIRVQPQFSTNLKI
jgi:hypothetical protein